MTLTFPESPSSPPPTREAMKYIGETEAHIGFIKDITDIPSWSQVHSLPAAKAGSKSRGNRRERSGQALDFTSLCFS